jgi:hypothetical protein
MPVCHDGSTQILVVELYLVAMVSLSLYVQLLEYLSFHQCKLFVPLRQLVLLL